nr:PREDICTED: probable polyol transporter 3 [Musa acuminata subsp. malaccensis]
MEGQGESGVSARGAKTYAFACAIIASIISILMGYDTGVMSGAMLFMKEDLNIQDEQVEVLAGIMNICALVGSLTAGRLSDWIGRRYTIVVASIIFFVGAVLMGLGLNYGMLFSGRCIAGVGVGYALMVAPVYSAEISSPSSQWQYGLVLVLEAQVNREGVIGA